MEGLIEFESASPIMAPDREASDQVRSAQLAVAARRIASIDDVHALIAAIPKLSAMVCRSVSAALLQVTSDGAVDVLSTCGRFARCVPAHVAQEARAADRHRKTIARVGWPRNPHDPDHAGDSDGFALIRLGDDAPGMLLALHASVGAPAPPWPNLFVVAAFASVAGAALSRARAEAALTQVTARYAATLKASAEGMIALDASGIVCEMNDVAAATLGVRIEDLIGQRLADVPGMARIALALAGGPGHGGGLVTLAHGDVAVRRQPYDGGVVGVVREVPDGRLPLQPRVGSVPRYTFEDLVGDDPGLVAVVENARRVARYDVPVLISGESGTGKEMLAQAIHNASARAGMPFLGVNVTAIPGELLESELFGYEGGTFTGGLVDGRAGKFELAGRGTLLLDEIGDMPLEMQGKLLRVLQERIVQRLGGARDIPVRARIIATTHRDLAQAVSDGRFRLDLYHRLRVLQLDLPPLRDRTRDIPLLVEQRLRVHTERTGRRVGISQHVLGALQAYEWPGNVRELHNVLDGEITVLPPGGERLTRIPPVLLAARASPRALHGSVGETVPLDEVERRVCEAALARFNGNVTRAAKALGVAKGTLYRKMKRWSSGQAR